jgi:hypothetical protein
MSQERDFGSGPVSFLTTAALRISAGALRVRVKGLWERVQRLSRRTPKRLRLCESLALGDRRFVAVVEFEAERFLLGGTPSSLVLLSRLSAAGERDDGCVSAKRRGDAC